MYQLKNLEGTMETQNDQQATQIQIPEDQSALSILGQNNGTICDGMKFDRDGWIYLDGKRHRKYFSYLEGWEHFWKPCLNDIAHLESVYFKCKQRKERRWDSIWSHIKEIVKQVPASKNEYGEDEWLVHAKPNHLDVEEEEWLPQKWWEYRIHSLPDNHPFQSSWDDRYPRLTFSFDWVKEPTEPKFLELGQELYRLEMNARGKFESMVWRALDKALQTKIMKEYPNWQKGFNGEVSVNGRKYAYHLVIYKHGRSELVKVDWEYQFLKVD